MSDESKASATRSAIDHIKNTAISRQRSRPGSFEPEIYVEDILTAVPNKYLAVNVAAQRARALNELELPITDTAKMARKPTTQALLELIEGRLEYELIQPQSDLTEGEVTDDEADEDVAAIFGDLEEVDDADSADGFEIVTEDFDEDA